jgi:hypothetical protein
MCAIVTNDLFLNIPAALTSTVIRKYFPQCEACVAGNMAQKPVLRESSRDVADFGDGEEIVADIKPIATAGHSEKLSFGGGKGALTIIDVKTNFHWGFVLKSYTNMSKYFEIVRQDIKNHGGTLQRVRIDNQFNNSDMLPWKQLHNVELRPSNRSCRTI